MRAQIGDFLIGSLLAGCTMAGGGKTDSSYLYYNSPPQIGGMFVAFIVTPLRGAALERDLASHLRALCPQNRRLASYRIFVYPNSEFAEMAKSRISQMPNQDDPQWRKMEAALMANYRPGDGVLAVRSGAAPNGQWKKIDIGNTWCGKED